MLQGAAARWRHRRNYYCALFHGERRRRRGRCYSRRKSALGSVLHPHALARALARRAATCPSRRETPPH
eukprot:9019190-Pyramimonas_sp.AAC.1